MVGKYTKSKLSQIKKRMIKNTKTDKGIERNDKMIEKFEDDFGLDLTSYYGEEDPKRIRKLINKLEKNK